MKYNDLDPFNKTKAVKQLLEILSSTVDLVPDLPISSKLKDSLRRYAGFNINNDIAMAMIYKQNKDELHSELEKFECDSKGNVLF